MYITRFFRYAYPTSRPGREQMLVAMRKTMAATTTTTTNHHHRTLYTTAPNNYQLSSSMTTLTQPHPQLIEPHLQQQYFSTKQQRPVMTIFEQQSQRQQQPSPLLTTQQYEVEHNVQFLRESLNMVAAKNDELIQTNHSLKMATACYGLCTAALLGVVVYQSQTFQESVELHAYNVSQQKQFMEDFEKSLQVSTQQQQHQQQQQLHLSPQHHVGHDLLDFAENSDPWLYDQHAIFNQKAQQQHHKRIQQAHDNLLNMKHMLTTQHSATIKDPALEAFFNTILDKTIEFCDTTTHLSSSKQQQEPHHLHLDNNTLQHSQQMHHTSPLSIYKQFEKDHSGVPMAHPLLKQHSSGQQQQEQSHLFPSSSPPQQSPYSQHMAPTTSFKIVLFKPAPPQ